MRRVQCFARPVAVVAALHKQPLGVVARFGSSSSSSATNSVSDSASGVLPAVDLAQRVTNPSPAFPASWSVDEPLPPDDPRVVWKEYYSLAEEKPYYHNVNTNETTHDIPEGFVTRFPKLYKRSGFTVDENGAVHRGGGGDGDAETVDEQRTAGAKKKLTGKQKLAAYGGGGLLWYLIVHNVCLATIFSLLFFLKIDLVAVARSYGFNVKVKRSEQVDEISKPTNRSPPFFKTLVLSVVLNKLLVPVQLVFTLATAPFLVHRLEPIAVVLLPKCKSFFHSMKLKLTGATS